jgi:pimeloyl-ACP methyl ester carboxylesterase
MNSSLPESVRKMLGFIAFLALVYIALCALLFFQQRSLIYFPQPRTVIEGSTLLTLPVDGAEVHVTTQPRPGANALVYFGGNGEDVSYSLPALAAAFPDHAIYLMHYRGYGGSSGKPTEAALFSDAVALFDRVHAEHPSILVVGRSLGSGVAAYLASVRPVARLVLVTPYDSLMAVASNRYSLFPVRWLMRDKFESWRYAERVTAPTLIIAAQFDEVIPATNTKALLAHFRPGVASMKAVAGASHNSISESEDYIPMLRGER